jgi:hypothetical protein
MKRIRIEARRAITPPNLLGIDRRMAYTHKKYHSGLIWIGVANGLAIRKFSGSVNILGEYITKRRSPDRAITNPKPSLIE